MECLAIVFTLLRTVCQLSPACAPSSTRNSNRVLSSCTGTPHSSSWYWIIIGLLLLAAHSHLRVRGFFKSPPFHDGLDKSSTLGTVPSRRRSRFSEVYFRRRFMTKPNPRRLG